MSFWGRITGADSRRAEKQRLAAIRATAVAQHEEAQRALRPGYSRTTVYLGESPAHKVTCDDCGAVVMLRTQETHTRWHESLRHRFGQH